jgi:hypothetical protein
MQIRRITTLSVLALSASLSSNPAYAWNSNTTTVHACSAQSSLTPESTPWSYVVRTVATPTVTLATGSITAPSATGSNGRADISIAFNTPNNNTTLVEFVIANSANANDGRSTARAYVVNCAAPVGTPGPAGPAGPQGPAGKDSTVPGPAGPAGQDAVGYDCLGKPVVIGVTPNTCPGQNGKDGVDGKDSTVPGPQGIPGNNGVNGKDGVGYDCAANAIIPGLTVPALCPGSTGTPGANGKDAPTTPVVTGVTTNARIYGRGGCVKRSFTARVSGSGIKSVAWTIDNKASGIGNKIAINPARYSRGTHKVSATVTYVSGGSKTSEVLKFAFQRCSNKPVKPRTTG